MNGDEPAFGRIFPSLTDTATRIDIDTARAELDAIIAETSGINEEADNEIAFDVAGCIAECTITDEDCERCIGGVIDRDIADAQAIVDSFNQRVKSTVDRDVSEVVGILMALGVPIQELFPPSDAIVSPTSDDRLREGAVTLSGGDITPPSPPPVLPTVPTVNPPPPLPTQSSPNPSNNPLQYANVCVGSTQYTLEQWLGLNPENAALLRSFRPNYLVEISEHMQRGTPITYSDFGSSILAAEASGCGPNTTITPGGTGGDCTTTVTVTVGVSGTTTTSTPTTTPTVPPNLIGTPLCDDDFAAQALSYISSIAVGGGEPAGAVFRRLFNSVIDPGSGSISWTSLLTSPVQAVGYIVGSLVSTVAGGVITAAGGSNILGSSCNNSAFNTASAQTALANFANGWFGIVPNAIRVNNEYTQNLLCQYLLPSGPEANSLRSRGLLTEPQWRLLVHANGLCEPWQKIIVDGMASVPTIDETNRAFKAGYINEETYRDYMRRNGVVNDVDRETYARLGEYVPGPSDLVRFMVRDSFDDNVVAEGGLDTGFDQKFTGRAREWAAAQGMDEDQFRYFWRSHWSYPSNTQLYEMLHRLRADTPIPGSNRTASAVTVEQIKRVLEINDIAPEWVDRLLAISYRPLTRVDARRAFELGDLDRSGLLKSYLDLGYAPEDAETLVRFSETSSGPVRAKKLGYAATSEVLSWYRDAVISREVAEEKLRQSGVPEQNVFRYLETEDMRATARNRRDVTKSIRRRYMQGEYSDSQAAAVLSGAGIDPTKIGAILFQWSVQREAKYKAPTVGMLCKWWASGFITVQEYERRATNLGYSLVDAGRIIQTCQNQDRERLEKEAEKFAKEAQARQDRIERKQKAAQREAVRLAEKLRPCKPKPKPPCPAPDSARNGQV